jgi:hypothetical protein
MIWAIIALPLDEIRDKKLFPRIKDRISLEFRGQHKLMKLMILLYNLHTRRVGIIQILNVYHTCLLCQKMSTKYSIK